MEQKWFPEIITERLLLRRLKPSDWKSVSYLRSNKEINKFVKRSSAESKEKALEFISKIINGNKGQPSYYWAITEKDNNEMIGSICLWNFSDDKRTAEVGYDLSLKFHGKGVMSESLKSVLDYGFKELKLTLIEAYTHKKNASSIKLLKRSGFTLVKGEKDEHNPHNVIYRIKNFS